MCSKERPPANFKPKSYQHREHEVLFLNEIMDMFKNIIFFPCSNRKVLLDCQLNVNCQWTIGSLFVPNLNLICKDFLSFSDAILKIAIFLFDFFPIFFFLNLFRNFYFGFFIYSRNFFFNFFRFFFSIFLGIYFFPNIFQNFFFLISSDFSQIRLFFFL